MNPGVHELRIEVAPPWPFRLGGGSINGLTQRRGAGIQRLLHRDGAPVHVAVIQPAPGRVIFGARAGSEPDAMWGIRRMRFATGVDDDLRPFHDAFRDDPLIGRAVRELPHLRIRRTPYPWEALLAAICEQLIEFERAVEIQRRLIRALVPRDPATGLRDVPSPAAVAGLAPARLAQMDLAPTRALTLRRAAAVLARRRPADRRPAAGLARAARDPRRRPVDDGDARAPRPWRPGPRPRRRPRLPQADRPPRDGQPAGAGRRPRGVRVLRALRRLARARRLASDRRARPRLAPAQSCSSAPRGSSPCPARNSFVSTCSTFCRCLISRLSNIQSA